MYEAILQRCLESTPIPEVNYETEHNFPSKLKPHITDYSSDPNALSCHCCVGINCFKELLNLLIRNVALGNLLEINSVWSYMLYKDRSRPCDLGNSWRTISSCPLVSKAMDMYVITFHKPQWYASCAPTQYMKPSSSHEVAAVFLTKVILHTVWHLALHCSCLLSICALPLTHPRLK